MPDDFVLRPVVDVRRAPIAPGESVTQTFTTPNPEGIYVFRSNVGSDAMTGQLVVQ